MTDKPFGTFFLPGPTEVRAEVLRAMTRPTISHRGKEFEAMFATIQAGMAEIFLTARPVYVFASSGTGAMETGVRNIALGKILSLVNGGFSERYAEIAESCGHTVTRMTVGAGETFDLNAVEDALRKGGFSALTVAHSETATGVLSDVKSIAAIARKAGVLSLVDSVSGLAGAELCTDEWGIDYVLTGSQKAIAIPAGLAFAVASPEYIDRAKKAKNTGRYFAITEYEEFGATHQTPATPALCLLYALEEQLRSIMLEGIERRWGRHSAMRRATEEWAKGASTRLETPVSIVAREGCRSPTVTAFMLPDGVDQKRLIDAVARRGFVIGGGQPPVAKTTFRIGHMGDHTLAGLALCLNAVEEALEEVTKR